MFGRFREFEDEPDWKEKLAEWRAAPLWTFQRPSWLHESPSALLLLFLGIALSAISVVYVVVPADALPSSIPGRWTAPRTSTTASTTTTTTTTIPRIQRYATLRKLETLPPAKKALAWNWIRSVSEFKRQDAKLQELLDAPPGPPGRRWANALLSAAGAAALMCAAWFISEERGRVRE